MSIRFILYVSGKFLMLMAGVMCVPAGIAIVELMPDDLQSILIHENVLGFVIAIVSSFLVGVLFSAIGTKRSSANSIREGFSIVTFSWVLIALFGAIPMFIYFISILPSTPDKIWLSRAFLCFTNAYFESISGFTGTGSTILTDIEAVPQGLLFWRSMTQWLGGMGVATLALAVFPAFGIAAYQIFRSESPGPESERLTPQLAQTAKVLWSVYVLMTVVQTILLLFGGMSLFDAICHAFATMATGGFSTKNDSIASFNSIYIDWVVISFMFLAGMNFMIHYRVLFGRTLRPLRKNREFHFFAGVILIAFIMTSVLLTRTGVAPAEQAGLSFRNEPLSKNELIQKTDLEQEKIIGVQGVIRHAAFQTVSLATTTGYVTADFDVWPNFIRFIFVILMFCGGCAGSTAGGIKMVRILVLLKAGLREINTMIQPRLISPLKIAGKPVEEKLVANIIGFIAVFLILFVALSAVMCLIVPDMTTAITAIAATMSNIGPGLSGVGATENFAWIPTSGKWVLILAMLLGRLEIFAVLIAFAPKAYKK